MRIHVLQHAEFEREASIGSWASGKKYPLSRTLLYEGETLPELDSFDWLVIMGGPMNIYEEAEYPFLKPEKEFIRQAVHENKTVLGICLGAQLLADVLGGKVYSNPEKEIGFFPVSLTGIGSSMAIFQGFPEEFYAFHWHGDTFSIPEKAVHTAFTTGCTNQAFIYLNKVVGLQFHLEATEKALDEFILNCGGEIREGEYIQTGKQMLKQKDRLKETNRLMNILLNNLEKMQ